MGNKTNDRNWAATERLRFIDACEWWKGIVNQQDLVGLFGVSMAQASSDLQRYLEMNPAAFVYDSRQKRYEATTGVKCLLTKPRLDEAVTRFLSDGACGVWNGWADMLQCDRAMNDAEIPYRLLLLPIGCIASM